MTPNARVHKHREKLRGEQCRRLEVWISVALIDQLREMARFKGVPVWSAVQDALKGHLVEYRQLLAEGQRLSNERARVLKLEGKPEYQSQGLEYNQQLAVHNERLGRFQGATLPDAARVR